MDFDNFTLSLPFRYSPEKRVGALNFYTQFFIANGNFMVKSFTLCYSKLARSGCTQSMCRLLVVVFACCFLQSKAAAQELLSQTQLTTQQGEVWGMIPETQGDYMLPPVGAEHAGLGVPEPAFTPIPLPKADYSGYFYADLAKYTEKVQRWWGENPDSFFYEDGLTQNLIRMGFYDSLLKWQILNKNVNLIEKNGN